MSSAIRRLVKSRADFRCEYCCLSEASSLLSFHVEHIIPRQHGGPSSEDNLALACPHCNLHKGPNLTGVDPDTGEITRLFHPRLDAWDEHFRLAGGRVIGLTEIGRTTLWLLKMNEGEQIELRTDD